MVEISAETIAAVEALFGVNHTGQECALMLDNIEGQITSAQPAARHRSQLPCQWQVASIRVFQVLFRHGNPCLVCGGHLPSIVQVFPQSIKALNTSTDRLKEYRSALITAAVPGQVDVQTHANSGTSDRRLDAIK